MDTSGALLAGFNMGERPQTGPKGILGNPAGRRNLAVLKLKLPKTLKRALRKRAKLNGISREDVVLEALRRHLEDTPSAQRKPASMLTSGGWSISKRTPMRSKQAGTPTKWPH